MIIVNNHVLSTLTETDVIFSKPMLPILADLIDTQPTQKQEELFQAIVLKSREFFAECDTKIYENLIKHENILKKIEQICLHGHKLINEQIWYTFIDRIIRQKTAEHRLLAFRKCNPFLEELPIQSTNLLAT